MAIVLGLLAALLYGSADFCGGLATRRSSIFAVTVVSQGTGLVLLASALPFFGGTLSRDAAIFGALGGLCGAIGLALLYHALSIGKMGVVSPITAILAAAVPVGIGVARGEHFSPWQAVGMAAALVAVALISLSHEPDGRFEFSTAGVKEAVASGIVLGGFYTFMALAGKHAGLYPLLSARLASTLFLVLAAIVARQTIVPRAIHCGDRYARRRARYVGQRAVSFCNLRRLSVRRGGAHVALPGEYRLFGAFGFARAPCVGAKNRRRACPCRRRAHRGVAVIFLDWRAARHGCSAQSLRVLSRLRREVRFQTSRGFASP